MKNGKPLNKKIAGAIIGGILIIAIAILAILSNNNKTPSNPSDLSNSNTEIPSDLNNSNNPTDSENSTNLENPSDLEGETDKELLTEGPDKEELSKIQKTMESFTKFSIIRFDVLQTEDKKFDENGGLISWDRHTDKEIIIANVDLENMTVIFESETDKSFEEIFGINYKGYDNAYEMLIDLMAKHGINSDFYYANYQEELYEWSGQHHYYLEKDSPILDKMIEEIKCDKINTKEAYYYVLHDTNGNPFISTVAASVTYEKDGQTFSKSIWFDISIEGVSSCVCGCGATNDEPCTCGPECDDPNHNNSETVINYE